ncbi:MAG: hypothetical protein PVG66_14590 [Chromatiales bacterium]|jgi:hypothetical protein
MDQLYKHKFNKAELNKIDKAERSFFFALGHVANEINILSKQIIWCSDFSNELDHITKGQITLAFFYYRMMAGKLNEANELIRTAFLSQKYSQKYIGSFDKKTNETLNEIKKYFGNSNIVNKIRNNHSFHYSNNNFSEDFSNIPDDLEIFLHQTRGNSLYYASEVIASYSLLKSCGSTDWSLLFDRIVVELNRVSKLMLSFSHQFMCAFIDIHSELKVKDNLEAITLMNIPMFNEINIPWFIRIEDKEE